MKYLKMLSVAAIAAAALMAFAGPASANPTLTSPAGTEYTGPLDLSATSSLLLKASVFNDTCIQSEFNIGAITTNNTTHAGGSVTQLDFLSCGTVNIQVLQFGSITIKGDTDPGRATVFSSGTQVTWETIGVSCVYGTTNNTTLGTLTPGNPAVVHIKASLPRISGSFLCANPATWEGMYTVTSPKPLFVD